MQSNFDKQEIPSSYQGTTSYVNEVNSNNLFSEKTPLYQQNGIVVTPVYQTVWRNKLPTTITTDLKLFLFISGFFYALWGIIAISLQIGLIVNSYSSYYHGFWAGSFLIVGGIIMMITAAKSHYPLIRLVQYYSINLGLTTVGLVFSIINYSLATKCTLFSSLYCDDDLASHLKFFLIITFSVAFIHTIINMVIVTREHQRTVSRSNSSVANY
ncbi:hypothetical protein I4U23_028141 [Adineta vaga]|nr:hypothetical protein I4U23_028141 [Adineta vaga]